MFSLPPLPYPVSALEPFIDAVTMEIHHDKHHATYVKNSNDLMSDKADEDMFDILSKLNKLAEPLRTKVRNQIGGHYNHTLFWTFMSRQPPPPQGKLLSTINSTFGNLDMFKEKFTASALGQFGSGWTWLVTDPSGLNLVNTSNQDSPISDGKTPLLGIDVWEHAYYLKYQNRRAEYIQAWWNVVNWAEVEKRFVNLKL